MSICDSDKWIAILKGDQMPKIMSCEVEEMRIKILNVFSPLENGATWDLDDFKESIGDLDDTNLEEERYVNYFTEIFPTSLKIFQTMARYQTSINDFNQFNEEHNKGNPYLPLIYPNFFDSEYQCDVLISLIGFSPEPVMHTICTLKPKEKIYLICSGETASICEVSCRDFVSEFVKENKLIKLSEEVDEREINGIDYKNQGIEIERKVTPTNFSDDIIRIINDILIKYQGENKKVAIDITGGKKIMLSGAFTIASIFSVPGFYVDFEEYDKTTGKPLYGTEFFNRIKNPLAGYILKKYDKWNYFWSLGGIMPKDEYDKIPKDEQKIINDYAIPNPETKPKV